MMDPPVKPAGDEQKMSATAKRKVPPFRGTFLCSHLGPELAILIGILALARILLLLAGLLPATLLLLAGLLARVLGLLARVRILAAHSGAPLVEAMWGNQKSRHLLRGNIRSKAIIPWHPSGATMAGGTGPKTIPLYKAVWPQRPLLPPLGSTVRK